MLGLASRRLTRFYSTAASSTLVVIEHEAGKISGASLAAITAAQKLGAPITAYVTGSNAQAVSSQVSKIDGVSRVIVSNDAALDNGIPEVHAPFITNLVKSENFSNLVAAHTNFGKNVFPRVAALLDVSQLSDVIQILSNDTFVRPLYAGNAIATLKSSEKLKIVTVRPTSFPKAAAGSKDAKVDTIPAAAPKTDASKFLGATLTKSDRPELASANKVVSGGRALKSAENFKLIYDLADKIGAAAGASRAAVEAEYCSNDLQVGQTGKIVAPELYIAVGISGAIQHLAGMKDSKIIVSINKDPEAPIFQVSDYGLVADLFKAVPEMIQKL